MPQTLKEGILEVKEAVYDAVTLISVEEETPISQEFPSISTYAFLLNLVLVVTTPLAGF